MISRKRFGLLLGAWLIPALGALAAEPRIYPSGETLPANHLKFYVHFAEPMRQGVFLDYCQLLDENGQPVLEPFRETELWSEDRCRLTLWLHPGRQKTGVNLNEEFGPVLEPNHRYTLVISDRWPTERGPALGHDLRKSFRTAARVTRQLEVGEWKIEGPRAGTRDPLVMRFPAPLDHALLLRCLRVKSENGESIAGAVETSEGERLWRFTPREPWQAGRGKIEVETVLEDLAGNSLARPFERDLSGPAVREVGKVVEVPFEVR